MKNIFETRMGRRSATFLGIFVLGGFCMALTNSAIRDSPAKEFSLTLDQRLDSFMGGQPFNTDDPATPGDGFLLEAVGPTPSALNAADFNAAENLGDRPNNPSPHTQAAFYCSALALNNLKASTAAVAAWETARHPNKTTPGITDTQFSLAASACSATLNSLAQAHLAKSITVAVGPSP